MGMEWILLVVNTVFTGYCLYAWMRHADKEYLSLSVIGVAVVCLLCAKLFFLELFSESLRSILNMTVYSSWILVLVALITIEIKKRRK